MSRGATTLNVNAHSSLAQTRPEYSQRLWLIDNPAPTIDVPFPGATSAVALSRGNGYGPAEINMSPLFLPGEFASVLRGRYGAARGPDGQWGVAGVDDDMDGTTDNIFEAGWPGSDDDGVPGQVATGAGAGG